MQNIEEYCYSIYLDASRTGYAGYMVETEGTEVLGSWSDAEQCKSSTWRELEAVNRTLRSFGDSLEGQSVKWYTDNKNVASIIVKGSKKHDLQGTAV